MRKLLALLVAFALAAPLVAQTGPKYGKNGGIGSSTSVYVSGEPSGGTYAINGTTGVVSTPTVNLRPGSPPPSPTDGNIWATSTGIFGTVGGDTSAIMRANSSRLRDTLSVVDFTTATPCTGATTNDDVAINAAMTRANSLGIRRVLLPTGICGISNSVAIPQNVMLIGQGGANFGVCGTTLKWTGTAGGSVVTMKVASGVLVNPGLSDVCIDGNASAAYGIEKRGVNHGEFANLYISGATSRGVFEDVPATPTFADQLSVWQNIYVSCTGSGVACWEIGNSSTAYDVASNHYIKLVLVPSASAVGFICGNADGNTFDGFYALDGGGAGSYSFTAKAGVTSDIQSCRENTFSGEAVFLKGFNAVGGTHPSFGNYIAHYKLGDGEPAPTIGSGATLFSMDSYGNLNLNSVVALSSITTAGGFASNTHGIATGGTMGINSASPTVNWLGGETTMQYQQNFYGNAYFEGAGFKFLANGTAAFMTLGSSSTQPLAFYYSTTNNASGAGVAATLQKWLGSTLAGDVTIGAGGLKLVAKTVATLPTCNAGAKGLRYDVTDATAPTWNATLTGGGTVLAGALCDGAAWKAF